MGQAVVSMALPSSATRYPAARYVVEEVLRAIDSASDELAEQGRRPRAIEPTAST
jgi:hypothetical protein